MNTKSFLMGAALAGMVAGLSGCASNSAGTAAETVMGQCHGINSCKGTGACGGKNHSCAGQNSCKGKGWLKMSEEQCSNAGGEFKA